MNKKVKLQESENYQVLREYKNSFVQAKKYKFKRTTTKKLSYTNSQVPRKYKLLSCTGIQVV